MKIILQNIYNREESDVSVVLTRYKHQFNFEKKPNFLVDKQGIVYEIEQPSLTKDIYISLVNEGCLFLSGDHYIDIYNNLYRGEVYQQYYRNYNFWATYPNKQILALKEQIYQLIGKYQIENKFVNSNIYKENIVNEGIISLSNTTKLRYDVTPAFDFEKLWT